jgi:hypothetical protein
MILDGTNGAFLPTWTTATRPASPSNGLIGYNSTTSQLDQYIGGAWASVPTGSASAGGSTTQLQYNNAGVFGGISGATTDGTRITHSTTVGVGGATPSTSGSGVTFPATQSASTNANTLDDYEEGTWTPTVGGTSTYSLQEGTYTKIGNLVNLYGRIIISSIGTGSTSRITGLPFNAAGGDYSGSVSYRSSLSATFASIAPEIGSVSASLINFGTTSIVGNYTSETVIFQNSSRIAFNIFYFV